MPLSRFVAPRLASVSRLALMLAVPLGLATAATAQTAPASPFTDAQRAGIEAIVKDYLIKHPEVLQEAIAEGEKRRRRRSASPRRRP